MKPISLRNTFFSKIIVFNLQTTFFDGKTVFFRFLAEIRLRTPLKSSQKPSSRSISCKFRTICTLPGRVRTSKRKNPLPSADDQLPSRVRTSKRKNPLCLNIVECVLIKRKAELLGCLDVKSLSTIFQTSSTLAALANDASTWHRVYAARSAAPLQTTARIEKKRVNK